MLPLHYVAVILLGWFGIMFGITHPVAADHTTPERIVDGQYTVLLSVNTEDGETLLRFFFRDQKSGRNLEGLVEYRFVVEDEGSGDMIFETPLLEAKSGIGESIHTFPHGGAYELNLEFRVAGEPDKVYKPDHWSLWLPGVTESFSQRYPIGFSELGGFAALFGAIVVVVVTVLWNKKKGPFEVDILKLFGLR